MIKKNFQNEEEFDQFLSSNGTFLGNGKEGSSFLVNNQVWKKYNDFYLPYYSQRQGKLTAFSDTQVEGFYFVKDLILLGEEKKFIASISDYARGKDLLKTKLYLCHITKIIRGLKKLETSVIELSKMGIVIDDLFRGNIIYNNGIFNCIDTNFYHHSNDDVSIVYLMNMRAVTIAIMEALFSEGYLKLFIKKVSKYKKYDENADLSTDPIYLLRLIKKELEEICGFELQKFAGANKTLAQMLKK